MMRLTLLLTIVTASAAADKNPRAQLQTKFAEILSETKFPAGVRISVSVRDVKTGKSIFEHQGDQKQSLASNTKILTLAAALHHLTPAFSSSTAIVSDSDLKDSSTLKTAVVFGKGTANLNSEKLASIARNLRAQGVREISKLCVDQSYFDDKIWPPRYMDQPKELASFKAPVAATSIYNNAVSVWITPRKSGSPTVTVHPKSSFVKVENNLTSARRAKLRVTTKMASGKWTITLNGKVKKAGKPFRVRRLVPSPISFALPVIKDALKQNGIKVRRLDTTPCQVPKEIKTRAAVGSTIRNQIGWIGKNSSNFHAELLLKTLGAEVKGLPGTWAKGTDVVHEYLLGAGIAKGSYRYENGSGLFDSSSFSANQMTTILAHAGRDYRIAPDLMAALSHGGIDGTLRSRLAKSPSKALIRAKTGTLANVSTVSGYLGTDSTNLWAFSILTEKIEDKWRARHQARKFQDKVMELLGASQSGSVTPTQAP